MKVVSSPAPLESHATDAFYGAAGDTLQAARDNAPVGPKDSGAAYRPRKKANARTKGNPRPGTYRDDLRLTRRKRPKGPTATIRSRRPQAGILERGGGPRDGWASVGPHVQRNDAPRPLTKAGAQFAGLYEKRLRSTPVGAGAITTFELGGETGLPSLELGSGL